VSAEAVRDLLDGRSTLTLACRDDEGPWAADVYFVRVGRDLLYFSAPRSRHAAALALDPRAAGTVHADSTGWRDIRGVQIEGRVDPVVGVAEKARITAAYLAKFPLAMEVFGRKGVGEKVALYRLTPSRVLFVSNAKEFGDRMEVEW
jgi:uncharacterized protein